MTLTTAFALAATLLSGPPPTAVDPVVEVIHDRTITDDFRWLEALESQSEAVEEWTTLQNEHTRDVLDALPGRPALEQRLEQLMTLPEIQAPRMKADRYFYRERLGRQNQPVLYMRTGYDGRPRAILDPNALDEEGLTSLDWYSPSRDGRLVAFGISHGGDENSTLHVLDVDARQWLADEIPGKVRGADWLPDGSGFFYHDLADVRNPYTSRVRFHRLGTHHRHDRTLFEQYKVGPLATTWGPFATISPDARWIVLGYYTSTKSNDLWVADLDRWFRTGELARADVIVGDDSSNEGPVSGDTLYLRTTSGAPNGRVFAVDLNRPARESWVEIIPERPDVLRDVALARGYLVVTWLHEASTVLEIFTLQGKPAGEIPLPGIGSASVATEPDRTEAFYTFASYNEPTGIWRTNLAGGATEPWERVTVPGFDPASIAVERVWYESADGTKVSMFVVRRADLEPGDETPTVLYGYGGFDIAMTPYFSATRIPWLEGGGILAVPHLRGGGEYGERWHEAGMLASKQNVFDDFIAAAEHLIKQGYTDPEHLAIMGSSNGGLLVGAAITQRPDLFAAAVCGVPLLDMLRYDQFLMARYWVPEYGDPADPEAFAWLRAYSPYHNVTGGLRYPAVLFTAGENDSRVHPMHARKMAALLQAVATNDQDEDPILLWVEREAGHGAGKPLRLRIRDSADAWSFVMWQTGHPGAQSGGSSRR